MRLIKPALLLLAVAFTRASAQSIECVRPASKDGACKLKLQSAAPSEYLTVKLVDGQGAPMKGVALTFAPSMAGTVTPTTTTNDQGLATVLFTGTQIGTDVKVTVATSGGSTRDIFLTAPDKPLRADWSIGTVESNGQSWYVERQLKKPVVVPVVGPSQAQCDSVAVRFKGLTEGTAIAPDTARGEWIDGRCVARARWRIGKEVGEQYGRVDLAGTTALPKTIVAKGRIAPRLMAGVLFHVTQTEVVLKSKTKPIKIEETFTGGKFTRDSVVYSIDSTDVGRSSPMLGVDWAPDLANGRLRIVLATNPLDARNEGFAGVSVLQGLHGLQREGIGYDFQFGISVRRPEEITNLSSCGAAPATCKTERKIKFGLGVLFSVDGVGLLKDFMTAFPLL